MWTPILAASLAAAVQLAPANPDVAAAAEAFTMGQRAELAHDYARAAEFYDLADSIAPAPEALRSAAKNWRLAGRDALAATRASTLLRRYPDSEQSKKTAQAVLNETTPRLTRVEVRCDRPCLLSADDVAVVDERALSHVFFIDPGTHTVVASFSPGVQSSETAQGAAGDTVDLSFTAPEQTEETADPTATPTTPAPVSEKPKGRQRLSPVFFAVGAVATAGLGGVTIWSGLNVLSQNDDYEADPTQGRYEAGRRAEIRTNALIAATAVVGAATIAIAVFTRWKRINNDGRTARRSRWMSGGWQGSNFTAVRF